MNAARQAVAADHLRRGYVWRVLPESAAAEPPAVGRARRNHGSAVLFFYPNLPTTFSTSSKISPDCTSLFIAL